jgi:hypothetical protein
MAANLPGWAIEIIGEKFDIDDLRESLQPPFDPWIEDHPDDASKSVLRSKSRGSLTVAADVFGDATRIVERLHGEALLIYGDSKPVVLGQIMKIGSGGKREPIIFAATAHFRVSMGRVRARATGVTSRPAPPPRESKMQQWFRSAETDDTRAELFAHLARADNWFDIYKTAELARRLVGGPKAIEAALRTDRDEWRQVWQTANCYRHAPDPTKFPLPVPPAELPQARNFLLRVIPQLL